jgi:hypothetical protein
LGFGRAIPGVSLGGGVTSKTLYPQVQTWAGPAGHASQTVTAVRSSA